MHLKDRYAKIKISDLIELLAATWELETLKAGGVDNWNWYGVDFEQSIKELCDCFGFEYSSELDFTDIAIKWAETKAEIMED